jgi:hypothetical protein
MMLKRIVFLSVFILITVCGLAQRGKVFIKGSFHGIKLVQLIDSLQKSNNIRFIYLNEVVDGVVVSGIFENKTPILIALETLLRDKPISFTENSDGAVVLFSNTAKHLNKSIQYFSLSGTVSDIDSGEPLPFVTVLVPGTGLGTMTDDNGKFILKPCPAGLMLVQLSSVGFESLIQKIDVTTDRSINVSLKHITHELKEMVITPSTFEISTVEATPLTLGKEEILHAPNMGKDIYRTLRGLPGIANNDFSAKARVRGGHSDETAVYLDNFLINDPFHLDEVDGSFSIFNTDYIDELKVLTGGFSARYTDRMSGIVDVRTFDHIDGDRYRASIDLLNASVLVQKKLNKKTNLFFNARRGYLDFLLSNMGQTDVDELKPRFSDMWSKVTYTPNSKHAFSVNALIGHDKFKVTDLDNFFAHLDLESVRNNINTWVNWKWFPSKKFDAITTLGYQQTEKNARFTFMDNITQDNLDNNGTGTLVFTNNSYYHLNENGSFEFGTELKFFNSHYQYREQRFDIFNSTPDDIVVYNADNESRFNGSTTSAFAQYSHVLGKLTLQPGVRVSSQTYAPALKWAPRFAASYDITPSLTTRWAYGIYYQPDLYFRLRTGQFQQDPFSYNSKAVHYTGSFSYSHRKSNVMLNLYHKVYEKLFDDYRYEFFNRVSAVNVLDVPFGTTAGYSQGVEIMVRQNYGKASMLSVSYAYARSRIRNADGDETFRDFDQPHTIIVNNIFRLPFHWNISLFWTYHSGYPYTPTSVDFITYRPQKEGLVLFYEAGEKNSARLPNYQSFDMRIEKTWFFRRSSLTAYVNVINVFNSKNIRSYWWSPNRTWEGAIYFQREEQTNIPAFISPGLSFTIF